MQKLKVITVVGTRPEIIRLSRVMALLDRFVNHIIVHTGQNYDYELNEVFFNELELRKPDYFMNADVTSLGTVVGDIMKISEEVFRKEMPDAVLVLGDTNSAFRHTWLKDYISQSFIWKQVTVVLISMYLKKLIEELLIILLISILYILNMQEDI
jgi:UDP-N-acetylglucosamine 2-epimerase